VIASTHVAADRHLSTWNFPLLLLVIGKSLVAENLRENQLARHRSLPKSEIKQEPAAAWFCPAHAGGLPSGEAKAPGQADRNDWCKA
jgi:hypothetical protein